MMSTSRNLIITVVSMIILVGIIFAVFRWVIWGGREVEKIESTVESMIEIPESARAVVSSYQDQVDRNNKIESSLED